MRSADKWRHEINQKLAEPAKHKANPTLFLSFLSFRSNPIYSGRKKIFSLEKTFPALSST
jgi:hypothetical protein